MTPSDPLAKRMLDLAAHAAMRGSGDVEPNPMVGAVVVREGQVLGIGHHARYGNLHAERAALNACRQNGHDPVGADMYVTLEPCAHTGKQPPCTEAIIDAGIRRVVIAVRDSHPASGGGMEKLTQAGIAVELCSASRSAIAISEPFLHRVRTGRPWVIAKWAQTIDGRIATRSGESQWISSPSSRRRVHRLRGRVDAIVTGLGTVIADDPMLTARGVSRVRRVARRVVLDQTMDIPPTCKLVTTAAEIPTTIVCAKELAVAHIALEHRESLEDAGVDVMGVPTELDSVGRVNLAVMLEALAERYGTSSVLVEAGPGLLGALLERDLIDEMVIYIAPLLLGDREARSACEGRIAERLAEAKRFDLCRVKRVESDIELTYRKRMRPAENKTEARAEQ